MAKVKFNPTLTSVKGAAGDYVFTPQGEDTIMRRRPIGSGSASEGQVTQRGLTAHLAQIWDEMDMAERGSYAVLREHLGYRTAYLCFSAVSKVAVNTGGDISRTAAPYAPPAALPLGLRIEASNNGSVFSVRIVGGPYSAAKIRVFATPAVPALGTTEFKARSFKPIALFDNLATNTSIAEEYTQKYGKVAAGGKFGVKLQTVTSTGQTGPMLFLPAVVFAPAVAENAGEDEQLQAA